MNISGAQLLLQANWDANPDWEPRHWTPNHQVVALHQPHIRVWVPSQHDGLDSSQHADVHVSGLGDNWSGPTEAECRHWDRTHNLLS